MSEGEPPSGCRKPVASSLPTVRAVRRGGHTAPARGIGTARPHRASQPWPMASRRGRHWHTARTRAGSDARHSAVSGVSCAKAQLESAETIRRILEAAEHGEEQRPHDTLVLRTPRTP